MEQIRPELKQAAPDADRIELATIRLLEKVPGVAAASVSVDPGPPVRARRIFLAVTPALPAEHVLDMARSLLAAQGIASTEDDYAVAQLQPAGREGVVLGSSGPPIRSLIRHDLQIHRSNRQATCQVDLLRQGVLLSAEATDLDTPEGRGRAAARATLAAAQLGYPGASLALVGAQFVEVFGARYMVVVVEAVTTRDSRRLAAMVGADSSAEEAACLASLRAIERWITA